MIDEVLGVGVQVRPTKNTHLDLVSMRNTAADGPRLQIFVIFGFDFGPMMGGDHHYEPSMKRGN